MYEKFLYVDITDI